MSIQVLRLLNQPVVETPEAIYVWIREGPYLTAGRGLWSGSPLAFGLNGEILNLAILRRKPIRIINGDKLDRCYEATGEYWFKFAVKHNAIVERKGIRLYLLQFSKEHFKTVKMDVQPTVALIKEDEFEF